MVIFSERFKKEFEVDAVEQDGLQVIRYKALTKLLAELGDAVNITETYHPAAPVYAFEVTIKDDTGVSITEWGSVNENTVKDPIAKNFVVETARSRALSNAVIAYFGFEDRCYSDVAVTVQEPAEKAPADKPVKATKPAKAKTAETADDNAAETEPAENTGEFLITFGNAMKGKKIKELTQSQLEWLAGDAFNPRNNAAGTKAKEAAKKFLASKKK